MKVVVVGATGNAGTSLLRALAHGPEVEEVVGVARRRPDLGLAGTRWVAADVRSSDLTSIFRGADAVVHLAWAIQPSRNMSEVRAINVGGSARVFKAVAEAGVPALVYASSVGAYSPGPKVGGVDEDWPTGGIQTSFYSRHKAEVETMLDRFELERPDVRVARLRPALIFKREAASEQRRYFIGPLMPRLLANRALIPFVPDIDDLRFQAVHSLDVGEAFRLAVVGDARGAFNIAADPVLDPVELGEMLGARPVRIPAGALRAAAALSWRLRLQPSPPGWLDMALKVPLMSTVRAREQLGWEPRYSSTEALGELLDGIRDGAGMETPPLDAAASGPLRVREFKTGVGARAF